MKCVVGVFGLIIALAPVAAQGQTPPAGAPQVPPAPVVRKAEPAAPGNRWYLGVLSGVEHVARTGPIAGGEFGVRLRKNLQAAVEFGWFKDVVTQSRIDEVQSFTTYLQQTQGLPASGDIDAPAWFGMAGLRYIRESSTGIRPYIMASAGVARVEFRPTFILDDRNVTTNVGQYGVTLGRDLLGPGYHLAYSGGAGVIVGARWYLDLGVRLTRINTPDHATDVRRVSVGIGRRF
jgi:opacity protein-like surface antigen